MKQERDLALTSHDSMPSIQLHLKSRRTPEKSGGLFQKSPGGGGIAVFDKYQTSTIILILVERMGGREACSFLSNAPKMVQI